MIKSSASGKRMDENRACTSFHPLISTEGMPVYEQKGAANAAGSAERHDFANGHGLNITFILEACMI